MSCDRYKDCKYPNLNKCKCVELTPYTLENQDRVIYLASIMRSINPKSLQYKRLLKLVKREKGEWFVNSIKHNFCFWSYMAENATPHTLEECANNLGLSISAIASIERKAMAKLRKKAVIID